MTNEKFTPGEWEVEEQQAHCKGFEFYRFAILTQSKRICMCLTDDPEDIPQMQANAHLIAASKEMYECVCDALSDLEMSDGMRRHFEAVLKKARGEE